MQTEGRREGWAGRERGGETAGQRERGGVGSVSASERKCLPVVGTHADCSNLQFKYDMESHAVDMPAVVADVDSQWMLTLLTSCSH